MTGHRTWAEIKAERAVQPLQWHPFPGSCTTCHRASVSPSRVATASSARTYVVTAITARNAVVTERD